MKDLSNKIAEIAQLIIDDAQKFGTDKDSKAAHARVRKYTLELEKVGKEYRKASVEADKK